MAYLKYKELAKYFYFYKSIDIDTLPKYVTDYVSSKETILYGFATKKDRGIFTDKKMVLFDIAGLMHGKRVITIPYKSVSTINVTFGSVSADMTLYVDSGYPLSLKYRNLNADDKTKLRELYTMISDIIVGNR